MGRTSMSFFTAFRLSLNNLLTKKGRTVLVAFAGSIGIIGIALIQSVSNGFQSYVDSIEEDALTSYPLMISKESSDLTSTILSLTAGLKNDNNGTNKIKEEQYVSNMLKSISTNDLKSFKGYINKNYDKVKDDITTIKYGYSVEPNIYRKNDEGKISKLNPVNLFSTGYNFSLMGNTTSTYTQMMDDREKILNSYDILAGRLPENYDEMIIVLSERSSISDFLIYYLGLRDIDELKDMITKIMSGEKAEINNKPLELTYDDLLKITMKLILPTDLYKYNKEYDIYEDMSENEEFLNKAYEDSIDLKIVGVLSLKEGVTTLALNPGVLYTSDLVEYIIDKSKDTDIVKKQLENENIDVISGSRFDKKKKALNLDFKDLIEIDTNKIKSAFNVDIDKNEIASMTNRYMVDISNALTTDTSQAKTLFKESLKSIVEGLFNSINGDVYINDVDKTIENYLNSKSVKNTLSKMEKEYVIPADTFKTTFNGLLKTLLTTYINVYNTTYPGYSEDNTNKKAKVDNTLVSTISNMYINNAQIDELSSTMAKAMTEAKMKKEVLTKVGMLTATISKAFSSKFNIDENTFRNAFKLKMTEEQITRIVTAMMTDTNTSANTNLISFGYQDIDDPTFISFYFKSFDAKEHFIKFIDDYNEYVKNNKMEEKEINYTDTTSILMGSVKTIVNAVTYVLIAFVSISLVVSSIMIGIITYISVYERTKEIGILRAIGASKRNISSIFNAETFIIGLLSGLFGIGTTYLLVPVINYVLHHFTGNIPLNAVFYITNALSLVALSVVLTLIGGLIPARAASKKDPVIALRTE